METPQVSGITLQPENLKQVQLHERLGAFFQWMQQPKDAAEVQRDSLQAVPVPELPMLF